MIKVKIEFVTLVDFKYISVHKVTKVVQESPPNLS